MIIIPTNTEITPKLILEMVQHHKKNIYPRLDRLDKYYKGQHAILKSSVDNKVIHPEPKYITRIATGYFIGNPVKYSLVDEESVKNVDIKPITDIFRKQKKSSLDLEIAKDCSIFGVGFELVFMSTDTKPIPKSTRMHPLTTFVVFNDSVDMDSMFAVNYYSIGQKFYTKVFTSDKITEYVSENPDTLGTQTTETLHYFKKVPVIMYQNNNDEDGDFEPVINLIDAYDKLQSSRTDDVERHLNSLLLLKGTTIASDPDDAKEVAKKMKSVGILELPEEEADAGFLTNTLDQSQVQTLADNLKKDIHMYAMVPNMTDENFSSNTSGVAMKYKLLGLEQIVQEKENYFVRGLQRRLKLYRNMMITNNTVRDFDVEDVEITFNRNLPANDLEAAQMINMLATAGLVSKETLAAQLSFVKEPDKEVEKAEAGFDDQYDFKSMFEKIGNPNPNPEQNQNPDKKDDVNAKQ